MSNTFDLKVRGFKELFKNLNRVEKAIINEIEDIIIRAAKVIRDDARLRVARKTGELQGSIEVKTIEIKRNSIKVGIGPVGKDVYYWYFLEKGTSKMAAQPYLRPAFDENKAKVEMMIAKGLQEVIEREGI